MLRFVRYVFFRLNGQQRRVTRDHIEARISAGIFMSISPLSLLVALDIAWAELSQTLSLYDRLGRWRFGFLAFGVVFWAHYVYLAQRKRAALIEEEFGEGASLWSSATWFSRPSSVWAWQLCSGKTFRHRAMPPNPALQLTCQPVTCLASPRARQAPACHAAELCC
jgi:hypothetical protein